MKFSENWLRTWVNPSLDSEALAHALTMAGLEVEDVAPTASAFAKVVVAQVLSVKKHPDADKLSLCEVNAGTGAPLSIVCGAANVKDGMKVACALEGASLPDGRSIKKTKVRGVESAGMLCSARELGLPEENAGLLALPQEAPVGADFRAYLELDDKLFTLKLTPNRADCLGVSGVAREVSAITATPLKALSIKPATVTINDSLPVKVVQPQACPRYCGRIVRGVNPTAPTPAWMVRRLERSDIRSLSALVDITNYVMLELGQPLHAFDLAQLNGGIQVRYARTGEKLVLLNEMKLELSPDLLVIADEVKALALAGIVGGLASAVSDKTKNVFLESAFFSPEAIAGKSRPGFCY